MYGESLQERYQLIRKSDAVTKAWKTRDLKGTYLDRDTNLHSLLYANDLVLRAETEYDLHTKIYILQKICHINKNCKTVAK